MKYTVALIAAAVGANAWAKNVTVVTEVVDQYTTYCPGPTQITHGTKTYTVTAPTTLTITDCPCTVTKPVVTTSAVVCHTCGGNFPNTTVVQPTGGVTPTKPGNPVPTAGAGKAAALSGAGLAGVVGLAAFIL
ncbi:mmc protein [Pochonia chlamydosporia 170]|uniref:Mmc protein n=1 Tax=Pochonia chlamydosporia 170 TaxID=1380566 RepID=A0A179F8X8_METCM|nr:mmc protein [Pochonia chlamydosporia 170]OAQ61892.1 mmc protein [Pochonia chlamydosporia 170]